MSEKLSLGQSIVQAINFLQDVYKDIGAMVRNLDEAMEKEKEKWIPIKKDISAWVSNSLDPERWLMSSVYRLYAPTSSSIGKKDKKTMSVVAMLVCLLPPKTYNEAVCLLAAVRFSEPKAYKEIWDNLDSSEDESWGSDRLFEFMMGKEGTQSIPDELLQNDLFPGATIGVAFTVPLCDLTDVQTLRNRIVTPLLQEAKVLGPRDASS